MALTSCSLASCSALPLVDAPAPAASASSLSPGFFSSSSSSFPSKHCSVSSRNRSFVVSCSATKEKTKEKEKENEASSAEEITRKYGLEAGLWKVRCNTLFAVTVIRELFTGFLFLYLAIRLQSFVF